MILNHIAILEITCLNLNIAATLFELTDYLTDFGGNFTSNNFHYISPLVILPVIQNNTNFVVKHFYYYVPFQIIIFLCI